MEPTDDDPEAWASQGIYAESDSDGDEPLEEVDVHDETSDSDAVEVKTLTESDEDAPNEGGLWIAHHDYNRVGIYRFARHQHLVEMGCIMSIHATAAEAKHALRPEATQPNAEAEVAMWT